MREILLTRGQVALVDDGDYGWLNQWKWCVTYTSGNWRALRTLGKTMVYMSRVIVNAPKGKYVDHKNHNTLDNQRHNLRICTPTENNANRILSTGTRSKYKGVYWDKSRKRTKRWTVGIKCDGVKYRLGRYLTEIEAAKAYDKKAVELFGEFAYLNFPTKD